MTAKIASFVWHDRFSFVAPRFVGEKSVRPVSVIVVGVYGNVEIITNGRRFSGRAFIVGPNVERSLKAETSGVYSLHLDPLNPFACELIKMRRGRPEVEDVSALLSSAHLELIKEIAGGRHIVDDAFMLSEEIPRSVIPEPGYIHIDPRVELVADWLQTHIPFRVDLPFLADLCGLSPRGLTHTFSTVTGISLRQYLLWVKVRHAMNIFRADSSLTEVAQLSGFSDSAHLSRAFRRLFSFSPSLFSNKRIACLYNYEALPVEAPG